jgi:teichuronic acid exporter
MTNIQYKIVTGIFYTALPKYGNVLTSILISATLARLLTPAEFGKVAIVSVFMSFFYLLGDLGIGPAIVQNKTLTKAELSSIFLFSILLSLVLSIVFYLAAPFIALYYNDCSLISICRLMSLAIFVESIRVVPSALYLKKLRFKQLGIISIVVRMISGGTAILLAYQGFSYYALVIGSILGGALNFLAYYIFEPIKITFRIRKSAIVQIAGFSSFQFLFMFTNYFARNSDNLLIGKYFNLEALGFYEKSYTLMTMPIANLTNVITTVLHPVLSDYQDDKKAIYNTYFKIVKVLSTIGFPLSIFLFFSANEIVTIVYGTQWENSIPVFKLLALTVGIQMVLSTTGSIFQATNRTDLLFYAGLGGAILMVSGIAYGVFVGRSLVDIGYGLIIAFFFNFWQSFFLLINRSLNFPLTKFLKAFTFPIYLSLGTAIGLFLVSQTKVNSLVMFISLKAGITILINVIILSSSKEHRELIKEFYRRWSPKFGHCAKL